jgi:catechol O-methyltransferase
LYEANPDATYPSDWSESDKPGDRAGYVSLEKSEVYATTAQGAFDLSGLGKVVKVSYTQRKISANVQFVIGSSTPNLRNLRKTLNMPKPLQFDMVFLDHLKPLYTVDLKVMEEEGLIGPVSRPVPSYSFPKLPLTIRAPRLSPTTSSNPVTQLTYHMSEQHPNKNVNP